MNFETISSVIYDISVSLSLLATGIWAIFRFNRRTEVASLHVKISKTETIKDPVSGLFYLYTEVDIKNNGNRDVNLYYDYKPTLTKKKKYEKSNEIYQAKLSLFQIKENQTRTKISEVVGLPSEIKKNTGRLRSGVEIKIPYLNPIFESGIYFVEFTIDIDMLRFHQGKDYKDVPIKEWSDRIYQDVIIKK